MGAERLGPVAMTFVFHGVPSISLKFTRCCRAGVMCNNSGESHWAGSRQDFTTEERQPEKMAESLHKEEEYEQQRSVIERSCEILNSSPILSLPNEVTCLIFDYAQLPSSLDEVEDKGKLEERDRYLMEVVVSHVCQYWRTISLGYSKLWTKFFYIASDSSDGHRVPLDRFEAYLRRSRSLPLCLWLDFRDRTSDEELNTDLLNRAIDHLERWKQFTLYADEQDISLFHFLLPLANRCAPLLEGLVLWRGFQPVKEPGSSIACRNGYPNPTIFTSGTPNLKFCVLDKCSFSTFVPPLWNITTLRICGDPSYTQAPQVIVNLLSLPSLQDLSLMGYFGDPQSVLRIEMPNLKRLQVSGFGGLWTYFPSIRAPQLETLLIHRILVPWVAGMSGAWIPDQYRFPALKMLWVSDSSLHNQVAHCFVQMTSEATNVLIATSVVDRFFKFVSSYQDGENLWPRLTVMTFVSKRNWPVEPYMSFARSRSRPFTLRLNHNLLSYWKEHQKDECTRLEEFCTLEAMHKEDWPVDSFWPKYMKLPRDHHKYQKYGELYDDVNRYF